MDIESESHKEVCNLEVLPTDGPRLKNVKVSLQATLNRLYADWKLSLFDKCFPSLSSNRALIEVLQKEVLQAAKKDIEPGVSQLIKEELESPLQELCSLISSSSQSKKVKAWRPSGNPFFDVAAHDRKVLEHELMRVKESLEIEQKNTAHLKEEVQSLRYTIEDNDRKFKERLQTLSCLNDVCDEAERMLPLVPIDDDMVNITS